MKKRMIVISLVLTALFFATAAANEYNEYSLNNYPEIILKKVPVKSYIQKVVDPLTGDLLCQDVIGYEEESVLNGGWVKEDTWFLNLYSTVKRPCISRTRYIEKVVVVNMWFYKKDGTKKCYQWIIIHENGRVEAGVFDVYVYKKGSDIMKIEKTEAPTPAKIEALQPYLGKILHLLGERTGK